MQLTEEQKKAIRSSTEDNNHNIKIIAYAGTGKTSVLKFIAEELGKKGKKCIYLAFNKAIVNEAKNKMPKRNTEVKTFHSLAYAQADEGITKKIKYGNNLGFELFCKEFKLDENYKFIVRKKTDGAKNNEIVLPENLQDNKKDFNKYNIIDSKKIFQIVRKTLDIYLKDSSNEITDKHIKDAIYYICAKQFREISEESIKEYDDTNQCSLLQCILEYSHKLWLDYCSPKGIFKIPHDVYLKLYALNNPIIPYDVILFDESQDTDKLMLSILQKQPAKIIFVGDPYQQIYDWRGAVNAMEKFKGKEVYLTHSFRFGKKIAEVANVLLLNLNAPKHLKGYDLIDSQLDSDERLPSEVDVVLSRTNAGLIFIALEYLSEYPDKMLHLEFSGNINLNTIAQWFKKLKAFENDPMTGKEDEVLCDFVNITELEEFCKDFPEDDISQYFRLYRKLNGNIKDIVDLITGSDVNSDNFDILFTTVHKSKGREWNNVLLNDDFHSLTSEAELRLMYVAVTRAKQKLYIGRGANQANS